MPVLSPFRPNPERCVHVGGDFTDELASKLLGEIALLRSKNNDPITVYINSLGGGVHILKFLAGSLDNRGLDNNRPLWIAVVAGTAASAGANLLALSDYAYAFPDSYILFHPMRARDLPDILEDANAVVSSLAVQQRDMARRLSLAMIRRVIHRYHLLKPTIRRAKKPAMKKEIVVLRGFVDAIKQRVSDHAKNLVEKTCRNIERADLLSILILAKSDIRDKSRQANNDAKVLVAAIKHEVDAHKSNKEWRINEKGIQQILSDYFLVSEYNIGEHRGLLENIVSAYGYQFLTPAEQKKYEKIKNNGTKAAEFLAAKTMPRIEPLWFYTVSLCRNLFVGDNRLEAEDAYWLGVVDEVMGTDLEGIRAVKERQAAKTAPSPTVPPPTPSQAPAAPTS